ncbi:MAG: glycoside hydrolase family 3 C-terminal domain-containing protein [Clostridia bacterium]|nr:glycoside hydrolase family 3 C-terminal domain-containing protein [Clostridia bacterium]
MEKKKKTGKIVLSTVMALVLVVAIVANVVLTGPLSTVMNMYFGKGEAVVKQDPNAANLDANYYTKDYADGNALLDAAQKLAVEIESEGIVLLKNDNAALPLAAGEKNVSLFGRTSVDPIYTGAGSAATEATPVSYREAFEAAGYSINPTLYDFYANHKISTEAIPTKFMTGMGPMDVSYTGRGFISAMGSAAFIGDIIAEVPVTDYPESLKDSFASYNGAAIVVIGRVGGEGCDLPVSMADYEVPTEADKEKSYLELDSREIAMLEYVKAQKDAGVFNKIVVVLNTANTMELGFLNDAGYGIDAAIWVGCLGDQGSKAVAAVLDGTVNPSGATVDTFVYDLTKDPSYVNFADTHYTNVDGSIGGYESGRFNEYEEGIYVGYRYYETAAAEALAGNYAGFDYDKEVVYPFGYGLSYTAFDLAFGDFAQTSEKLTFNVNVTNTGDKAGKKVVELYAEAPYTKGGIEKSKVVLVAFSKTDVLQPGASETVKLTVPVELLASYDYKTNKCYVLEAGEYKFYASDNAHSWATAKPEQVSSVTLSGVVYNEANKRLSDKVAATNLFDDVSGEFTDAATAGKPQNFSRADFAGTFPTAPTETDMAAEDWIKAIHEKTYDEQNDPQLGNVEGSLVYTKEMPTVKASNGLQLIDMRGLEYDDPAWDLLLDELDMNEVAPMLSNAGFNTAEMLAVGKPATLDYDGPMGWSTWVSAGGSEANVVGFPAEEVLAATWNVELAEKMGKIVGEQGLVNGFVGWYAPAMNTHRNAFAGRNYEYFSEDGLLAGKMAAAEVSGCMDKGTYTYLKHFALNDKENGRNGIATWANEQAIREIYLKPFEIAVKEAKATIRFYDENDQLVSKEIPATTAIMSAYNRIGCTWTGGRYELMTQVLRNEWGFRGTVLSDYYGGSAYMDPDQGVRAGNDMMLNTFADGSLTDKTSATAVASMRRAAHNVLYMAANSAAMQGIVSGATITYQLAGWQKLLIAGDVVVALLLGVGVFFLLRKKKA